MKHHNDTFVDYQRDESITWTTTTKVMEQMGCKGSSSSFVKTNTRSMKHWVNFRHWWQLRNNDSETLPTIQSKSCLLLSSLQTIPAHFLLFTAFAFSPHLFSLLSSHPFKQHSTTLHSLLVQQLLITICFFSSPFCQAPLALSFHFASLFGDPTYITSALTEPQLALQSGSRTQADLELCKEESSWFVFKWKEGIIQEHGILSSFYLKIYVIAAFDKNFHKTSLSEA